MTSVNSVTDTSFEKEVLQSKKPVLIDFWAQWCGPCKQIAPLVEDLASKNSRIKMVKCDIETNPNIPSRYGIRAIPTLIIFSDGRPIATKVGSVTAQQLSDWVEDTLSQIESPA